MYFLLKMDFDKCISMLINSSHTWLDSSLAHLLLPCRSGSGQPSAYPSLYPWTCATLSSAVVAVRSHLLHSPLPLQDGEGPTISQRNQLRCSTALPGSQYTLLTGLDHSQNLTALYTNPLNKDLFTVKLYWKITHYLATFQGRCDYIRRKVVLCTPWRYIEGVEVKLHTILTSALDGNKWSASHYTSFTLLKKKSPPDRKLSEPQNQFVCGGREKHPCSFWESNSGSYYILNWVSTTYPISFTNIILHNLNITLKKGGKLSAEWNMHQHLQQVFNQF